MTDLATRRTALLSRLAELDERMHGIEAELDAPHSKDMEDQAVEIEGDEVLERLGERSADEVKRIRLALERIRDGEYGFCQECGYEIAPGRLDLLPDTALCVACAGKR